MKATICIFHGYSGEGVQGSAPKKPESTEPKGIGARERNRNFEVAAHTLEEMVRKSFSEARITTRPTWTHRALIEELIAVPKPISQVHILAHGGSSGLSLGFKFYRAYERLARHAREFIADEQAMRADSEAAVVRALAREDGLIAQRLSRYGAAFNVPLFGKEIEQALINVIAAKHEKDAYWHIWGCRAGNPFADYTLGSSAPPSSEPVARKNFLLARDYRDRLQKILGGGQDGIAIEIAKRFKVHCTAVAGPEGGGLDFFHRDSTGNVKRHGDKVVYPVKPFWLWLSPKGSWRTYDPTGKNVTHTQKEVLMFGKWRPVAEVEPGKVPPRWLVDGYHKATL